jgi:transposase
MVDIDTHKIIDLIESRELQSVTDWLKTYPNLEVVSRDGSLTYKNAITASHPNAIQVSDRFHLLKNLTEYAKDYLKKTLDPNVIIDKKEIKTKLSTTPKMMTLEEKFNLIRKKVKAGATISNACKDFKMDIRAFRKINSLSKKEKELHFKTKLDISQEEKINRKMKIVSQVRGLHKNNYSKRKISIEIGISRATVSKYLDKNFSPIHGNCGNKNKSILDPYIDIIEELTNKNYKSNDIDKVIRKKGYSGSASTIRNYISKMKKNLCNNQNNTVKYEKIKRSILFKLLYKEVENIKVLSKDIVTKAYNSFPTLKTIIDLVTSFRKLLKLKSIPELLNWLNYASSLNISEINSFINGLNRDIEAVMNAILYEYNNGLAEGKVNKLKVTKRIMYGRNSFEMLRKKMLRLENS